jgi:cytochrome c oxidase assembly protein subunit 15
VNTPFSWLARRVAFGQRALRIAATGALLASVLIVVTGGVVRVTGSGLGCPEWPSCTPETFGPTAEMGMHGIIEFGNRLLTGILCVVVGWLIVVARLQENPAPGVTRMAWAQFWVIVLNAIVGGITVWVRLNPYIVAAHFLAASLLVTAAAIAWHRVWGLESVRPHAGSVTSARLSVGLVVSTALLIVVGTIVTGAGPHAGDSAEVERIPVPWEIATGGHIVLAVLTITIGGILLSVVMRDGSSAALGRRIGTFLAIVIAQGLIGVVQLVTHLAELVVVLHLLGSTLVWIGVLRVLLDSRLEARVDGRLRGETPEMALTDQ